MGGAGAAVGGKEGARGAVGWVGGKEEGVFAAEEGVEDGDVGRCGEMWGDWLTLLKTGAMWRVRRKGVRAWS